MCTVELIWLISNLDLPIWYFSAYYTLHTCGYVCVRVMLHVLIREQEIVSAS